MGTVFASYLPVTRSITVWMMATVAMASVHMSCIVANTIDFESELDLPPSIVGAPGARYPLNQIARIDLDAPLQPGETPEFPIDVIVRDPNLNQVLQYRILIDYPISSPLPLPYRSGEILATGTIDRVDLIDAVPWSALGSAGACHRIELLVSGEFLFGAVRSPAVEGDVATVTWWVEITDSNHPTITSGCN
ncbi:MAG: hypothetical protein R3A47_10075 [Polyangiales bacterium]